MFFESVFWRRYRCGLAGALQRVGNEAVGFHLLDKATQISQPDRAAFWRTDRLADFLERVGQDPRVRVILGISIERLAYAGGRIKMLVEERLDTTRRATFRIANEDSAFQSARQIKIVNRAETDAQTVSTVSRAGDAST